MRAPEFWTSDTTGAKAMAALLSPLAAIYGFAARRPAQKGFRAKARVLCVGNLTVGGTGKTPIAIALGHRLAWRGKTIFLTRGYRGQQAGPLLVDPHVHSAVDVGDEAVLLAAAGPTIVARDRAAGARLADSMGARFIVMDDGFQNPMLIKNLSLVVIDAQTGFGNGRLLPAGPLRESPQDGFARASALVLMGDGAPKLPPFSGPVLRASLRVAIPEALRAHPVLAFAAIGRPEKFFQSLRQAGLSVADTRAFPDHHVFAANTLASLRDAARQRGFVLATTEKDYVRIAPEARDGIVPVPARAVFADTAALDALLDSLTSQSDRVP